MQRIRKLLFGNGRRTPENLPDDVREALERWRAGSGIDFGQAHFNTRYVILDVATSGLDPDGDRLLGIAALGLGRDGLILPDDAFALDLPEEVEEGGTLDRQLVELLEFLGRSPLVTYQAPFVGAFLRRLFEARLGLSFEPEWIDLAWVLPDLFKERIDNVVALDAWLEAFGIDVPGRRDPVADCVALARLLQLVLPRAAGRGADTAGKLVDIARARRWLRHSG